MSTKMFTNISKKCFKIFEKKFLKIFQKISKIFQKMSYPTRRCSVFDYFPIIYYLLIIAIPDSTLLYIQ